MVETRGWKMARGCIEIGRCRLCVVNSTKMLSTLFPDVRQ